jgi:pimeloyl-ACP methyl ester carboxylesterase
MAEIMDRNAPEDTITVPVPGGRVRVRLMQPTARRVVRSPTLVFLHEALGSLAQWREFPGRLAEACNLPAMAYERLGHGHADPLPAPRDARYLHHEASAVLPRVLDATGVKRAVLVGHSDGGSIALLAAAAFPRRVAGLVTMAAHVFVEPVTVAGIRAAVENYRSTDLPRRLARHHGDKTDALFRAWSDTWLSAEFQAWNIEDCLPRIRCPLLVIQGADDHYGSAAQVETIARGAGGPVEVLMIPGCGHSPHLQAPTAVMDAITRFARSITG